jgi:hypothetical protein
LHSNLVMHLLDNPLGRCFAAGQRPQPKSGLQWANPEDGIWGEVPAEVNTWAALWAYLFRDDERPGSPRKWSLPVPIYGSVNVC